MIVLHVLTGTVLYACAGVLVAVMFRRRVAKSSRWEPRDAGAFVAMCIIWPIGVFVLFFSTNEPRLLPRVKKWLKDASWEV